MNTKKWVWAFAIVCILLGVLGFTSAQNGLLFGLFAVDTMNNIVYLLTGVIAAIAATRSVKSSRSFLKIFGSIYLLIALLGFMGTGAGDQLVTVLGVMKVNLLDNVLHLVMATIALAVGFGNKK